MEKTGGYWTGGEPVPKKIAAHYSLILIQVEQGFHISSHALRLQVHALVK